MKLPLPKPGTASHESSGEKEPILVYGGSSATGALAIQFAKLSGFHAIATCSPSNNDYVKSLGASAVFDYHSPTCGADIRAYTKDQLYYAFDTISEHSSPQICADALSSNPGPSGKKPFYGCIQTPESPRSDVERASTLAYSALGESFKMGPHNFEAKPQDYEFGTKFFRLAAELLREGKFKVHRPEVREGGLEGVIQGMDDLRQGKVSGKKIVYKVA